MHICYGWQCSAVSRAGGRSCFRAATAMGVRSCLRSSGLTLATMAGVIGGAEFGLGLRGVKTDWTDREVMYVRYIGELFLRMLKALILPLIIPSLISAIGSLDMSLSGKVGGRAVGYYMATTVLAVILGIILVQAIHPGRQAEDASDEIQGVRACSITR